MSAARLDQALAALAKAAASGEGCEEEAAELYEAAEEARAKLRAHKERVRSRDPKEEAAELERGNERARHLLSQAQERAKWWQEHLPTQSLPSDVPRDPRPSEG